jgi:tetratricopeptide (TPR) repeat protein
MGWKIVSTKKQRLAKMSLALILSLVLIYTLVPSFSYAVTKYQGIEPGKTTKDEVSKILGEPTKEINSSTYEYSSSEQNIEKIVIEYKESTVDKIDVHFSKPIPKSGFAKAAKLPESPTSEGESPEGNFQEYYGSMKSLILTYKGKTTKSGIKIVSYLNRERFESMSKGIAKKPEEPQTTPASEEQKKTKNTTSSSEEPKVAEISLEAKQHLQQGMTYVSLAQKNPATKSENYENARLEFNHAIELYPNYAEAYSNRGVAYMQQKKFNKALEDLKKAAELKPKDPIIHYNLTALYSLQNQLDLALDELDKSLEYGFDNYDALKPSGPNSDPDLKNLRKDPEFRKILEKHKVFILK